MAEEPQKSSEDVLVAETQTQTQPDDAAAAAPVVEAEKPPTHLISQSVSFKEETNVVADLPEAQKKALDELKHLIQDALNRHELAVTKKEEEKKEEKKEEEVAASEEPKAASEEPKVEEKGAGEKKEVVGVTEVAEKVSASEEKKEVVGVTEVAEKVSASEEKKEVVGVTEVVEKASSVDGDGSKTVEAIQETIVSATATATASEEAAVKTETEEATSSTEVLPAPEEVDIWGIPLLADERSDVVLLKFLRARDFKVKDAFTMIKNTVRWRRDFGIDALVEEDLGNDWDKVVFSHGYDKEGHPVCYNVFGEFEDKDLYHKTFSEGDKFIRWRIQFLERSVRKLGFTPSGISTIVQVNDLKNSPGLGKRELRQATNHALQLLQDNYPELVAKQVFINVPWWYLAFSRMISAFLTQRTKSKFVFAGPSKSAETLFKYIAPELVPLQYGGLSRDGDKEFTTADPVTEVTIKPAAKHAVEFPVSQASHLVWELRVVGWDVTYGAEFVPSAEHGYTVIVQKSSRIAPTDETVITNSFKIGEPGKVVLTIDNQTSKKKKLLYRSKTKPISE